VQQKLWARKSLGVRQNVEATELGATKPAIHNHFGSKTDLGLAVTRR
jgi:Bacterial regulatory proteins, tetR family